MIFLQICRITFRDYRNSKKNLYSQVLIFLRVSVVGEGSAQEGVLTRHDKLQKLIKTKNDFWSGRNHPWSLPAMMAAGACERVGRGNGSALSSRLQAKVCWQAHFQRNRVSPCHHYSQGTQRRVGISSCFSWMCPLLVTFQKIFVWHCYCHSFGHCFSKHQFPKLPVFQLCFPPPSCFCCQIPSAAMWSWRSGRLLTIPWCPSR